MNFDIYNPDALAYIRNRTSTPIASCESLYGIRDFRLYFQKQAMDVASSTFPGNGIWQSYKIAAIADAHEVNVAPHNFYGHLSSMMSAHFVRHYRTSVSWRSTSTTYRGKTTWSPAPPEIVVGHLIMPDRPGWGCDIDEDAVRAHPPK